MTEVELGRSGILVQPFAFGGNVFGWTVDQKRSFELLDAYTAAGFSLIDTADMYSNWVPGHSGGESEEIIGRWLAKSGQRDNVIIATKLGMEMGPGMEGLSKQYISASVDRSLQRLQTDYIDLYQAHIDDTDTSLEETLRAFSDLIDAGKVRAIGASNYTAERFAEALSVSAETGLPRYETLQPRYNLYDRKPFEDGLGKLCADEQISVIPYYSLGSGFLTGKYRSQANLAGSSRGGMIADMLNPRGMRILEALDAVAAEHHASPAQIALAWLLTKGIAAPIASATSIDQLEDILSCVDITLSDEQARALDSASR